MEVSRRAVRSLYQETYFVGSCREAITLIPRHAPSRNEKDTGSP